MGKIKTISCDNVLRDWCNAMDDNNRILNYRDQHQNRFEEEFYFDEYIEKLLLKYNDKKFLWSEELIFIEKFTLMMSKITKKMSREFNEIDKHILVLTMDLLEKSIINNIGPHKQQKVLDKFTKLYDDQSITNDCIICLGTSKSIKRRILPCKHEFHQLCIDKWLKSHMSCAMCRSSIKDINSFKDDIVLQFIL
jgi:hypothetical protein